MAVLSDYNLPIAPPLRSKLENHPFLLDIGLFVDVISSPYLWVIVDDDRDDLKKGAALTSSEVVTEAKSVDAARNLIAVVLRALIWELVVEFKKIIPMCSVRLAVRTMSVKTFQHKKSTLVLV